MNVDRTAALDILTGIISTVAPTLPGLRVQDSGGLASRFGTQKIEVLDNVSAAAIGIVFNALAVTTPTTFEVPQELRPQTQNFDALLKKYERTVPVEHLLDTDLSPPEHRLITKYVQTVPLAELGSQDQAFAAPGTRIKTLYARKVVASPGPSQDEHVHYAFPKADTSLIRQVITSYDPSNEAPSLGLATSVPTNFVSAGSGVSELGQGWEAPYTTPKISRGVVIRRSRLRRLG